MTDYEFDNIQIHNNFLDNLESDTYTFIKLLVDKINKKYKLNIDYSKYTSEYEQVQFKIRETKKNKIKQKKLKDDKLKQKRKLIKLKQNEKSESSKIKLK
tara:strand:- start:934 stop:1233 length:300 start_codon:yes stop_codon:yes gene_type:complete